MVCLACNLKTVSVNEKEKKSLSCSGHFCECGNTAMDGKKNSNAKCVFSRFLVDGCVLVIMRSENVGINSFFFSVFFHNVG